MKRTIRLLVLVWFMTLSFWALNYDIFISVRMAMHDGKESLEEKISRNTPAAS